jgi:energy-converting hydrogenase Eha subunit H
LEELPHIPRVIVGTFSKAGVRAALDVLCGIARAGGTLTYDIRFQ